MYANVNRKACIQCGLCPSICPEVFSLSDGEPAQAITDPVPEDCRLTAHEAADSCPTAAISLRERPCRGDNPSAAVSAGKKSAVFTKIVLYKPDFL